VKRFWVLILIGLVVFSGLPLAVAATSTTTGSSFGGYIKALNTTTDSLKVTVATKLSLEKYDGNVAELSFAKPVSLSIDGIPVKITEFLPGMEVWGELSNNQIKSMQGLSASNPGYISPQTLVRRGMITKIESERITIKQPDGKTVSYSVTPATVFMRESKNIDLADVYAGDQAKLYFDDIDATSLSRVELEGASVVVQNLLRGQLNQVDEVGKNIGFKEVKVWKNGAWETYQPTLTLPYNVNSPVYTSGQLIPAKNLKQYRGKTVYMAISNKLGRDRVEKMVINSKYETTYKEKIEHINWYGEALELANKRNLTFNQGTIIINNNRLMDAEALDTGMDTVLVADSKGMANVINVLDSAVNNNSNGQHNIYLGRLDKIAEQELTIVLSATLENNRMQKSSGEETLLVCDDTVFFDADNNKTLNLSDFKKGNYAVDGGTAYAQANNLKDWYGYIYTDGDMVISAAIKAQLDTYSLLRVSTATVAKISDGTYLELSDVKDWSSKNEEWMLRSNNLNLVINQAAIVRNGKVINDEDLRVGERLYLVRDDVYGKMLIVK